MTAPWQSCGYFISMWIPDLYHKYPFFAWKANPLGHFNLVNLVSKPFMSIAYNCLDSFGIHLAIETT